MYNPTTRLLTILELLQAQGQISGSELARTLEVDERSVRRYITMLRDMGIPIDSVSGRFGGYVLRPGYRLPPMMFDEVETVTVITGLRLMQELASFPPLAVGRATAKIERVLPQALRQKSQALREVLTVELTPAHAVSSESLLTLTLAVADKQCVAITYVSASGDETKRIISPYGVVLHGRTWYIPTYCHLRDDLRLFRLDRLRAVASSSHPYHEDGPMDVRAFVFESLANMPGMFTFEVLLDADLETVQHYVPASTAVFEDRAGQTLMRCYTDDPHWLARFLAQMELPFTVQKSAELRQAIELLARRLLDSV
ncbi:MAG: WYL domain-containing protein [Anaerolineaceae bacterium]|nr:WYL domain-containing protein [Anaerolineaceae bacterium]